jgi:hypothetical protein
MWGKLVITSCLLALAAACGSDADNGSQSVSKSAVEAQLTRLEEYRPTEKSSVVEVEELDHDKNIWCFRVSHQYRSDDEGPWGDPRESGSCKVFYHDPAVGTVEIAVPDPYKQQLQDQGRWPSYVTEATIPAG